METHGIGAHGTDVHSMKAHCGKKKRLGTWIRIAASLCALLGWWGLFYPQLALTPDTVKVNGEETGQRPAAEREWSFDDTLYAQLLSAGRGQVRLRSRLLTDISSFWEAFHDRDRAESK